MKLSPKHKCLWRYITERCDQAGVWEPNYALASLYIGETVTPVDMKILDSHVEVLPSGKVFIPDFINFQYGQLSEKSPAHKPVFRAIIKNSLSNRVFNRVSNTLQEKEEYKEEEEVKEKEEEGDLTKSIFSDEIFIDRLKVTHPGKDLHQAWNECYTHHSNAPNPPKEEWLWKQKLNTWLTIKKLPEGKKDKPNKYKINA